MSGEQGNSQPVTDTTRSSSRFLNPHPSLSEKGNCNHFKKRVSKKKDSSHRTSAQKEIPATRSKRMARLLVTDVQLLSITAQIHEGEDVEHTGDQIRDVGGTFQRGLLSSPSIPPMCAQITLILNRGLEQRPSGAFCCGRTEKSCW